MLTRKSMKTVQLERPMADLQDNVRVLLDQVAQVPVLDSNLVSGVSLSGATVQVPHKLGRAYTGYLVTKANGSLQVWDLAADNQYPATYLVLRFSGTATTATFLVF